MTEPLQVLQVLQFDAVMVEAQVLQFETRVIEAHELHVLQVETGAMATQELQVETGCAQQLETGAEQHVLVAQVLHPPQRFRIGRRIMRRDVVLQQGLQPVLHEDIIGAIWPQDEQPDVTA